MEPSDAVDWEGVEEWTWSPLDGDAEVPPAPPRDPPRGSGGGGSPHPDRPVFNPWATAVGLALLVALGALQMSIIAFGARGGPLAVYALSGTFAVLFLGPFLAGSVWLDRHRRGGG